jgi:dienelactone hydrolase
MISREHRNLLLRLFSPLMLVLGLGIFAFAQEPSGREKNTFKRLDSNQNGTLEKSELPIRFQQAFGRLDADQDQVVTIEEYIRFLGKFRGSGTPNEKTSTARKQPNPKQYYGSSNQPVAIDRIEKLELKDKKRDKTLETRITFPKSGGPFPVIVFSHGLYGSKDNYLLLTEFWASHGYVVIQVNHADSLKLGTRVGDPKALQAWNERPGDISFIIDSLNSFDKDQEKLEGKIDGEKIGVGGHSFGANTTQLVAGAKAFRGRKTISFAEPRLDAALLMSGQGPGEMLTEDSWKDLKKPMMVMSGSADGPTRTGQPAEWRKKPYELSPSGDKYLIWIKELDHGFGDITGANRLPYNADHIAYTQATTLAFWDYYLKKKDLAKSFLIEKRINKQTDGKVNVDWK